MSPLKCGQDQFDKICQNLSLYGNPGFERIKIVRTSCGFFPQTEKKHFLSWQGQSYLYEIPLFLKENMNWCVGHSDVLAKLKPIFKVDSVGWILFKHFLKIIKKKGSRPNFSIAGG